MRIYISGPLQGSTDLEAARAFYDSLATIVGEVGHTPYVPHHATDPIQAAQLGAHAVFSCDLVALNNADAVIAHVGLASTGVGAEIALATASGRRVLGLKRPGERGSRFAEGLIDDSGGRVVTFHNDDDLRLSIHDWLAMPRAWFGFPTSIKSHRRMFA